MPTAGSFPAGLEPLVDAMAEVLKTDPAVLEKIGPPPALSEWLRSTMFIRKPESSSICSIAPLDDRRVLIIQ